MTWTPIHSENFPMGQRSSPSFLTFHQLPLLCIFPTSLVHLISPFFANAIDRISGSVTRTQSSERRHAEEVFAHVVLFPLILASICASGRISD